MTPIRKMSAKAGLSPGALVYVGEERKEKVTIHLLDYDEQNFQEKDVTDVEDCFPFKRTSTVTWINVRGIHDVGLIEKLGNHFGLHPLVLEDIANTEHRPKLEEFDNDYLFVTLKMLGYDESQMQVTIQQASIILGKNFVISFQEGKKDVFEAVRNRIRNGKGRIRKSGADYLYYALIDAIVDGYFVILEKIGDAVEDIEEVLVKTPGSETLSSLHTLKTQLISLRKSVWPLREVISGLERAETTLIKKPTRIYLRDVYDHTIQVIDNVETFRDITSGMLDIYLSSVSNKMNEVMKVLTIFASIFIPLTFIAGVYGMNFENMPELSWGWGYPVLLGIMATAGIGMVIYFRRKKWL